MKEQDTIHLLRECNTGTKMAVRSIDDMLEKVQNQTFKQILTDCKQEHTKLGDELHSMLLKHHENDEDISAMAKGMSWLKTNVMMAVDNDDKTLADIMTDGCNMGIKSLTKYLNEYTEADEESKSICKKIIELEDKCIKDIKPYL